MRIKMEATAISTVHTCLMAQRWTQWLGWNAAYYQLTSRSQQRTLQNCHLLYFLIARPDWHGPPASRSQQWSWRMQNRHWEDWQMGLFWVFALWCRAKRPWTEKLWDPNRSHFLALYDGLYCKYDGRTRKRRELIPSSTIEYISNLKIQTLRPNTQAFTNRR